jgi:acyl-CoA dehydrogenase
MRGTCSHGFHLSVNAPVEQIMPTPFADIAAESMVSISHLLWSAVWTGIAGDALSRAQAFVTVDARNHPGVAPAGAVRLASAFNKLVANEASIADVAGACDSFRSDPARAPTLGFALNLNALKVNVSTAALAVIEDCMMICGLESYRNGTVYSMGRHLRDIHSARLMIGNDRILANTGQMMLLRRPSFGARA